MALFDSETMKLAWRIKKAHNLAWGEALRLAIKCATLPTEGVNAQYSFFGIWRPASVDAVAGHFWGLGKAYAEIGDTGRSIAFTKVAKVLYGMNQMNETVCISKLRNEKFIGESTLTEMFEFFVASATGGFTDRTVGLIVADGAVEYGKRVHRAFWQF